MCEFCDRMRKQTGYRGQKYAVFYTTEGVEIQMGWQNQPSGGLEDVAKLMPGVTSTSVRPVHQCEYERLTEDGICRACGEDRRGI